MNKFLASPYGWKVLVAIGLVVTLLGLSSNIDILTALGAGLTGSGLGILIRLKKKKSNDK